jgi:hypothetical protein
MHSDYVDALGDPFLAYIRRYSHVKITNTLEKSVQNEVYKPDSKSV